MKKNFLQALNRPWILAVALCAVTFVAYLPSWNGKPVWDDDEHITKPALQSLQGLANIWTRPGAYRAILPGNAYALLDRVSSLGKRSPRVSPHKYPAACFCRISAR
jgi:hypothetical protein